MAVSLMIKARVVSSDLEVYTFFEIAVLEESHASERASEQSRTRRFKMTHSGSIHVDCFNIYMGFYLSFIFKKTHRCDRILRYCQVFCLNLKND